MESNGKKIGILTHCIADNYGANLQALSTGAYLSNHGFSPVFFNWNPYPHNSNSIQVKLHETFLERMGFTVSQPCKTEADFLSVIDENELEYIIVGSDCVLTHKPKGFSYCLSRKGIERIIISEDYQFPNPFWLPFLDKRDGIKTAMISGSCGCSDLINASSTDRPEMNRMLSRFSYISVRDNYTRKSLVPILGKEKAYSIPITPDPVFYFNKNFTNLPSREEIMAKYKLSDKYVVLSFYDSYRPSMKWLQELKKSLNSEGLIMLELPMPQNVEHTEADINVQLPLDTLDWYCLIKYSYGYVGNNMHPIIVAMHNAVPFFSINHHGKYYFPRYIQSVKHTKEYELLKRFNMLKYHIAQNMLFTTCPREIVNTLIKFDKEHCRKCADILQSEYEIMMTNILEKFHETY